MILFTIFVRINLTIDGSNTWRAAGHGHLHGAIRTDSAGARVAFVLAGHGLSVLPRYDVTEPLRDGQLVELFPEYAAKPLTLFAVYPRGTTKSRAIRSLLDMFREYPPS